MSEYESIQELEHTIEQLKKHIELQDHALYRLQCQLELVLQAVDGQKIRLEQAMAQLPSDSGTDEKPPHY